jgi:glycosyltransferase involved in cell wall biosynthesis
LLATLSQAFPVFLTLHDAWMLSGHCAHSFECERWKTGCGNCPDLTIPKAIKYDNSALNWKRKREIYKKSKLYISTPCQWLMDKVNASILSEACIESKVIPYGIDHSTFFPSDSLISRQNLGIEHDAAVLLFSANGIKRNRWKDFAMMKKALEKIGSSSLSKKIVFLALGEQAPSEFFGHVELRFVPYRSDKKSVADFYRAADIYLHAAKADTFPNAVLEALSCGTPILATAVGGIPEQVKGYGKFKDSNDCNQYSEDEATGILSSSGDVESFVNMLTFLIENDSIRKKMGVNASKDAKIRFSIERQVYDYLDWYQAVLRNKAE